MARHLRIEYPGAWYHVMNRASDQQKIFCNAAHYNFFLDLLAEAHGKYKIEIHAYCLMESQYDLLIRTPVGGLSKAMRHINGNYTQQYNRLNNRRGALFSGRYKAVLIDPQNYLLPLSRHIHLHPARENLDYKPEEYPWSSCQFYTISQQKPWWLFCDEIIKRGHELEIEDYTKYIFEGINQKIQNLYDLDEKTFILGDKKFVYEVLHGYKQYLSQNSSENKKIKKILLPTVDDVVSQVSHHFNVDPYDITHFPNRSIGNLPRQISLYLATKLTGEKNKDIAKFFKNISYKGVSQASRRMSVLLNYNEKLCAIVKLIENKISIDEC